MTATSFTKETVQSTGFSGEEKNNPSDSFLLLETGDFLLLENGDNLIFEEGLVNATGFTKQTTNATNYT